jgi:glucose-6-phosphate 1-dehydrogenase
LFLFFRAKNREELDKLLNGQFVDRVEIVMKERIGNKGIAEISGFFL